MIEPRCLIDGEGRAPLFQGSFVGHGKWFRGPWMLRTRNGKPPTCADGIPWCSATLIGHLKGRGNESYPACNRCTCVPAIWASQIRPMMPVR